VFEVKALYLEPGVRADALLVQALANAIQQCATWHATALVRITWTSPSKLAAALRRALRATYQPIAKT